MIKVTISDMENTKRYDNEAISFESVLFGKDVPHLTLVIKQNISIIDYFVRRIILEPANCISLRCHEGS